MNRLFALLLAAGLFVCSISAQTPVIGGPLTPVAWKASTTYSSTAAIAPATIYTTPSAGMYQVCSWVVETVAGTGGSFTPVLGFTSAGHAFSGLQIGASLTTTSQWTHNGNSGSLPPICPIFWADGGTAVTYGITSTATGSPTIAYSWVILKLQ